jgi:cysteine synthase
MEQLVSTVTPLLSCPPATTPIIEVVASTAWCSRLITLKHEGADGGRSIKDRTAAGLLDRLESDGRLAPGNTVIESTSGNLGVALARMCRERYLRFVAVVDPHATDENVAAMRAHGAEVIHVDAPDDSGGYLKTRLCRVRAYLVEHEDAVWTDQYHNPANPLAHYLSTAPELFRQADGPVAAVFVAVSTGGTIAGITRWAREHSPRTKVFGVDARGSAALGGLPGRRVIAGLGSSQPSSFVSRDDLDGVVYVDDEDVVGTARALQDEAGVSVGGSSAATIFAAATMSRRELRLGRTMVLCADPGRRYASSIYDDGWLAERSLVPRRRVGFFR